MEGKKDIGEVGEGKGPMTFAWREELHPSSMKRNQRLPATIPVSCSYTLPSYQSANSSRHVCPTSFQAGQRAATGTSRPDALRRISNALELH